jgi:hypothetical protein
MIVHPAVIVHGVAHAEAALAPGLPVTLLSAPGAAGFAGCLWWRQIVVLARATHERTEVIDILDCADASGSAMGALRSGVCRLVLWRTASGWDGVAAIAERQGGFGTSSIGLGKAECRPPAGRMVARRRAPRRMTSTPWLR